jgi:hypothetical protein
MVMTRQRGGETATCPVADLAPDNSDILITANDSTQVFARKGPGGYRAVIVDRRTGTEKAGPPCPGDPDDYDYNILTEMWSARKK